MDALDKQIVDELHFYERVSLNAMAKQLHTSTRTMRRRISQLVKNRIIEVVAIPNPQEQQGWALIGLKVAAGTLRRIALELAINPHVYFVTISMGCFDILCGVQFESVKELTDFVDFELSRIPGINSTDTMPISRPRKYYTFYWTNKDGEPSDNTPPSGSGARRKQTMDDIDQAILMILMKNGLTPIAEIKEALNQTDRFIRRRIERMENNNVFIYGVISNQRHLLRKIGATIGIKVNSRSADSVIEDIIPSPLIRLAAISHGRFNIILTGRFGSMDALMNFVDNELTLVKGIDSIEVFLDSRPTKYYGVTWPILETPCM